MAPNWPSPFANAWRLSDADQDTDRGPSRPAAAPPARERVGRSKAQPVGAACPEPVERAVARAKQVSARTICSCCCESGGLAVRHTACVRHDMKALVKNKPKPGLWLEEVPNPVPGIND